MVAKNKNKAGEKREPKVYLTKRLLLRLAKKGFKEAGENAMRRMGYIVIAQDGWVIKKYADGRIEKLSQLETALNDQPIILD